MSKHASEGRKPRQRCPYVAMVEGEDRGVPFRTFYKRMDAARRDALRTRATLTDLFSLRRQRFVNGAWQDA